MSEAAKVCVLDLLTGKLHGWALGGEWKTLVEGGIVRVGRFDHGSLTIQDRPTIEVLADDVAMAYANHVGRLQQKHHRAHANLEDWSRDDHGATGDEIERFK